MTDAKTKELTIPYGSIALVVSPSGDMELHTPDDGGKCFFQSPASALLFCILKRIDEDPDFAIEQMAWLRAEEEAALKARGELH